MDELESIEQLVSRARDEAPQVGSISGRILARIRSSAPSRFVPLSVFAVVSAAAATIALALGAYFWLTASDPMTELYAPLQVGQLW